jgi:hypothetical protein
MRTNARMAELLAANPGAAEIEVPPRYWLLVNGGIKDIDDCVFLRSLFHHDRADALELHHDRTGYECAVNAVHLEDYLEPEAPRLPASLALTAMASARMLAERLEQFGNGSFRIIATVSGRRCTLRFHKLRPAEAWVSDDLDAYGDTAVFVLDTQHLR